MPSTVPKRNSAPANKNRQEAVVLQKVPRGIVQDFKIGQDGPARVEVLQRALRLQQRIMEAVMWEQTHLLQGCLSQLQQLPLNRALAVETGLSHLIGDNTKWPMHCAAKARAIRDK